MALDNITPILQLGFAAVMAYLIWRGYEKMTGTMIDVVKDNTIALTKLEGAIAHQSHVSERLDETVSRLGERVAQLEKEKKAA